MNFINDPAAIEAESFAIIATELGKRQLPADAADIIKRVIHTSADFDYADNLVFSPGAVTIAQQALLNQANIITDTKMALAGINKGALQQLGVEAYCFIDDDQVIADARQNGTTRSWAAVHQAAARLTRPLIFVVGNAPTALYALHELITTNRLQVDLIIAVPVGFVNVVESKELILTLPTAHIVARGRKGGSNVAAAIVNALTYSLVERADL